MQFKNENVIINIENNPGLLVEKKNIKYIQNEESHKEILTIKGDLDNPILKNGIESTLNISVKKGKENDKIKFSIKLYSWFSNNYYLRNEKIGR